MASCKDCQRVSRSKASDYQNLLANCLKNRNGTCLACQKLIGINRRIEYLRRALDSLDSLLEERDAMASTLNEHHDPFLNRLPVEVISHVFVQCRPIDPSVYTSSRQISERDLIKAVFTLCQISRNWRNVALSTPELWTIFCTTITRETRHSSIQIIRQWFERSGVLPLFIQLDVDFEGSEADDDIPLPDAALQVLSLVAHHAQRCEILDIALSGRNLPQIFPINKPLGLLQHLKVGLYEEDEPEQHIPAAPQSLTLRTMAYSAISTRTISWKNLTKFVAETMYSDHVMSLLSMAPRLSFCSIDVIDDLDYPTTSPLYRPSMRTLIIGNTPCEFWDAYTFPSLETLRISDPYHGDAGCWGRLLAHLDRSRCKLKELEVEQREDCSCQAQLVDVLKLLPDLEMLTFKGNVLDQPFFSLLDSVALSTTSGFLNKLKSLTCATYHTTFYWSELIMFLTTINCKDIPLQSFEFRYSSSKSDPILLDEETSRRLFSAVQGLDFKLLDYANRDLVEKLRFLHNLY